MKKPQSVAILFVALILLFYPVMVYGSVFSMKAKAYRTNIRLPEQDLKKRWIYFETPHFKVIFPQELYSFAQIMAETGEKMYDKLSKWTDYHPRDRIDLVITDNNDYANGYVRNGPKGLYITIHAIYPYDAITTGLDNYKDWYESLLIHELTHVFHFDRVEGTAALFRKIFGNIIYPNSALPLFYTEGFAAYVETVKTGGGRGNSDFTEMYLRSAVYDGDRFYIDRSANRPWIWPMWQGYYLFGVSFINYLSNNYGEESLLRFNRLSARDPLSLWGGAFKKVFGGSVRDVWNDWVKEEKAIQNEKIEEIVKEDVTPIKKMIDEQGYVFSVAFSRTGRYTAYSIYPVSSIGGIYIYDYEKKKISWIKKGVYAYELQFSEDESFLYYIRSDIKDDVYIRRNIYRLDLAKKREKRITPDGHVQGFAIYDQDTKAVLTLSGPRGTNIVVAALSDAVDGKIRVNIEAAAYNRQFAVIEDPAVSPDEKVVAFSIKKKNGDRSIYITNLDNLKTRMPEFKRITPADYSAYSPVWYDDHTLFFIGDENGVFNIHRIDLESGRITRVTNVITGIADFDISPGGRMIVTGYTGSGYEVGLFNLNDPVTRRKADGSVSIHADLDNDYNDPGGKGLISGSFQLSGYRSAKSESSGFKFDAENLKIERYRAADYLVPGYWFPFAVGDGIGFGPGISVMNMDPIGRYSYKAAVAYDLFDNRMESYGNFNLLFSRFSCFASLFLARENAEHGFLSEHALMIGAGFPIVRYGFRIILGAGYIYEFPYSGFGVTGSYYSESHSSKWREPERGLGIKTDIFINTEDEPFMALDLRLDLYSRPFRALFLKNEVRLLTAWGNAGNLVRSGKSMGYTYIPVDGVYTPGYPDAVSGELILQTIDTIGIPVASIERGIGTIPVYMNNIILKPFFSGEVIASRESEYSFVVNRMNDFFIAPSGYIRTSAGVKLQFAFTVGYENTIEINLGYVNAFSAKGRDGIFLELSYGW